MADALPHEFLSPPSRRPPMADNHLPPNLNGGAASNKLKQPPVPLVVPAGHAALRILCHASLVGGFIGKSGSSIKQLQLYTASKIRVEDSLQPGSDDRVIVIVAPNTPFKKLRLHDGEEEYEVSAVQDAALRAFEKVLEVSAEVDGALAEFVSCGLLVDATQAGSVIGKGGKTVEKLRRESGARIRVLFGQQLPPGIVPPDEVVEIEGEVLAVKKALLGVSGCLQECPVVDKSTVKESRPLESAACPAGPDLRVAPLQLTALSEATDSLGSAFAGRPLSLDDNKHSASDPTTQQQQEVVFKILCSNDRVGGVIGRGGSIVKALQERTGATISVGAPIADCNERVVTITSTEDVESAYSPGQRAVALVFSRSIDAAVENGLETGSNKDSSVIARLLVPSNQVGCLLGKGGAIISEMRKASRVGIRILRGDQVPKCASEDDEVVEISGQFVNVQGALFQVTSRLRNNLFAGKVASVPVPRSRMSMSAASDASLQGRVRQATQRQGLDPLPHPRRLDHSPSPGLRTSEVASGVNPRTFVKLSGAASADTGIEIGRANRPVVTNTTVEILVPENAMTSIYGENGSNLARIRQISGAKVMVHEARSGSSDRTVIISGTPDETQAAQSLLHAFILTGSA
uniref:K Homology domain-containing protein n=1 Tax=Opuntia streptacantha TaxID=393608 RepID=A0A7C9A6K6_OPUST